MSLWSKVRNAVTHTAGAILKPGMAALGTAMGGPVGGVVGTLAGNLIFGDGSSSAPSGGSDAASARQFALQQMELQNKYNLDSMKVSQGYNQDNMKLANQYANEQAAFNATQALNNWKYLQSNAHQFEQADLRAAGLNPILSATNSQIAGLGSVSGTSSALGVSPLSTGISSPSDFGLGSAGVAANSAYERQTRDLILENGKLQNEKLKTEIEGKRVESAVELMSAQISATNAQTEKTEQDIKNSVKITEAQVQEFLSRVETNKATAAQAYALANSAYENAKLMQKEGLLKDEEVKQLKWIRDNPKVLQDREFARKSFEKDGLMGKALNFLSFVGAAAGAVGSPVLNGMISIGKGG